MKFTLILLFYANIHNTFAQDLGKGITYSTELSVTTSSGDNAPLWLSANRHGMSSIEGNSGYIRAGIFRSTETDSLLRWHYGYGMELAGAYNNASNFLIPQLYGEVEYLKGKLILGAKEIYPELKNPELSSGDMTYGINTRPIPQVRVEMTNWWKLPITDGWMSFKGHISYGWLTDGNWQKDFTQYSHATHTTGSKIHSKAGYILMGKKNVFPLTLTAGAHTCAQFGGEAWNVGKRMDDTSDFDNSHVLLPNGPSAYWHAFFPAGNDASDGDYNNAEGNSLGSYKARLQYYGKGWSASAYMEHFFEDHSQVFWQYDWKDFMWGVEINFPKNPIADAFVLEYLDTRDQTGGIYHDHTPNLPDQISGIDNYYNHNIYGAWQHWGQAIGNPLLLSPIYNTDGRIHFAHNRITAFHLGISGNPSNAIHYRILYSHIKSLGTYAKPTVDPHINHSFLAECTYTPLHLQNFSITASIGNDWGTLTRQTTGGNITIRKKGILR